MPTETSPDAPAYPEGLQSIAEQLRAGLENPVSMKFGELLGIVQRLHGELAMMKDNQGLIQWDAEAASSDLSWLADIPLPPSTLTEVEIQMLAASLSSE